MSSFAFDLQNHLPLFWFNLNDELARVSYRLPFGISERSPIIVFEVWLDGAKHQETSCIDTSDTLLQCSSQDLICGPRAVAVRFTWDRLLDFHNTQGLSPF